MIAANSDQQKAQSKYVSELPSDSNSFSMNKTDFTEENKIADLTKSTQIEGKDQSLYKNVLNKHSSIKISEHEGNYSGRISTLSESFKNKYKEGERSSSSDFVSENYESRGKRSVHSRNSMGPRSSSINSLRSNK